MHGGHATAVNFELGVGKDAADAEAAEGGADGADEDGLGRDARDIKAGDQDIAAGANLRERGDVDEPRRGEHKGVGDGGVIDFGEGDAARSADVGNLDGVAAGGRRVEQSGVLGGGTPEGKRADRGAGRRDLGVARPIIVLREDGGPAEEGELGIGERAFHAEAGERGADGAEEDRLVAGGIGTTERNADGEQTGGAADARADGEIGDARNRIDG